MTIENQGCCPDCQRQTRKNRLDSQGLGVAMYSDKCPEGSDGTDQVADRAERGAISDAPLDKSEKANQTPGVTPQEARERLQKRARAKYSTLGVIKRLISLSSSLKEKYQRSLGCCSMIQQHDGTLTSYYCGYRWCVVCNRIRMARRIDAYRPVFEDWTDQGDEVCMVTLTIPNVRAGELAEAFDEMRDKLKLCRRAIRRTRELPYQAVRATECTFNAERKDFHPHFHLAVRGRATAHAVVEEWLKRWDEADRDAQDVREWDGTDGGLKELTKYCTKLIGATKDDEPPPAWALDVIFRALEGRHLFRPVGFDLTDYTPDLDPDQVEDFEDELESTLPAFNRPDENVNWWWDVDVSDWVDPATGECLTGYEPTEDDRRAHFDGNPPP